MPEVWKDVDMADMIDVQIHPTGASLAYLNDVLDENFPGQLNLSWDDVSDLRDKLNEAWFNRYGIQPMSVQVHNVQPGDIIPGLGLTVASVDKALPYATNVMVHFFGGSEARLGKQLEITVHRRIS